MMFHFGWSLTCRRTTPLSSRGGSVSYNPEISACPRGLLVWSILLPGRCLGYPRRGVAGRPFGLVRLDLLLQIGPSASGCRACYVLRPGPLITSFLPPRLRGGPRDCVVLPPPYRRPYGVQVLSCPPPDR